MSEHPGKEAITKIMIAAGRDWGVDVPPRVSGATITEIAAYVSDLEARLEKVEAERDQWENRAAMGDDVLMRTRVKLASARNDALEEAAGIAERDGSVHSATYPHAPDWLRDVRQQVKAADCIAASIRALKDKS
jgi:hypothetical protein